MIPFETSRATRASSRDVVSTVAFRRVVAFSRVGETFSETKVSTCPRSFFSCADMSSWKLLMVDPYSHKPMYPRPMTVVQGRMHLRIVRRRQGDEACVQIGYRWLPMSALQACSRVGATYVRGGATTSVPAFAIATQAP